MAEFLYPNFPLAPRRGERVGVRGVREEAHLPDNLPCGETPAPRPSPPFRGRGGTELAGRRS
jgi:hypothetical protein